jgi:hypothetical protein
LSIKPIFIHFWFLLPPFGHYFKCIWICKFLYADYELICWLTKFLWVKSGSAVSLYFTIKPQYFLSKFPHFFQDTCCYVVYSYCISSSLLSGGFHSVICIIILWIINMKKTTQKFKSSSYKTERYFYMFASHWELIYCSLLHLLLGLLAHLNVKLAL